MQVSVRAQQQQIKRSNLNKRPTKKNDNKLPQLYEET